MKLTTRGPVSGMRVSPANGATICKEMDEGKGKTGARGAAMGLPEGKGVLPADILLLNVLYTIIS